jgi:hypothetical protein
MRIGDAVEAIFDMACVVSHEARIGAGRDDDVVPVEARNDRHGELGAGRQEDTLLLFRILIGDEGGRWRTRSVPDDYRE